MKSRVIEKDGFLFVQDPFVASSQEPIAYAPVYPLEVRSSQVIVPVGAELSPGAFPGEYLWYPSPDAYGVKVRLPQLGRTQSAWREETPLKAPRGGPWRYSWGEWVNSKTGRRVPANAPKLFPEEE